MILTWGGLRGALPMVLVLSLPKDFPHRELLVSMTFGVVILSILVHGLTMSPLLRWLGIGRGHQERAAYELTRGKLQAAHAALEEIEQMSHVHFTNPEVLASLRREYEQKVERDSAALEALHLEKQQLHAEELQWARRHLLLVEKDAVIDAFHRGLLSQAVQEKLLADIDAQLLRLESGETDKFTDHTDRDIRRKNLAGNWTLDRDGSRRHLRRILEEAQAMSAMPWQQRRIGATNHEQTGPCQPPYLQSPTHGNRGVRFPGGTRPGYALVVESRDRRSVAAA